MTVVAHYFLLPLLLLWLVLLPLSLSILLSVGLEQGMLQLEGWMR